MNIQTTHHSPIVNRFHTEAATAGVNEHVSKKQISGLLTAIKNTNEKLTIADCNKMKQSVGTLRCILAEQNSKMLTKKEARLDQIDAKLDGIINSQLKSILKNDTTQEVPQRRNGILKAETSQSVGGSKLN